MNGKIQAYLVNGRYSGAYVNYIALWIFNMA